MDLDAFARELDTFQRRMTELSELGPLNAEPRELLERMTQMMEELVASREELRMQRTHLVDSEEKLAAERRRFEELWDTTPFGLLIGDAQGLIERANAVSAQLFGMRFDHLAKKPLTLFVADEERSEFRRRMLDVVTNARPDKWEARLVSATRVTFPALVWVRPILSGASAPRELRWTILDVTADKRRELELAARCRELERSANALSLGQRAKVARPALRRPSPTRERRAS
ncbi:MAG TPA: PAS domain-containing protein [Thermoanaerobaculia bacterium]|nr:PAS domain-containing protein [Thermoanaerobaculia bacterium]